MLPKIFNCETFGEVIATTRVDAGLNQKQLAAKVIKEDGNPISPQYLNDLERDRRNPPSDHLIDQLSTALNVDRDLLYAYAWRLPPDVRKPEHVIALIDTFESCRRLAAVAEDVTITNFRRFISALDGNDL